MLGFHDDASTQRRRISYAGSRTPDRSSIKPHRTIVPTPSRTPVASSAPPRAYSQSRPPRRNHAQAGPAVHHDVRTHCRGDRIERPVSPAGRPVITCRTRCSRIKTIAEVVQSNTVRSHLAGHWHSDIVPLSKRATTVVAKPQPTVTDERLPDMLKRLRRYEVEGLSE